ncbi:MAG TPA: cytochrome c3 family protein [Planctomycetota bacterium]|nr:cytochrome c3 family protein [Planctomycetota bacterium]
MWRVGVGFLVVALLGTSWLTLRRGRGPHAVAVLREEPGPAWTGSEACAGCHERETRKWQASTHSRSVRGFSEETVGRPFDGEVFTTRGLDHRLGPGAEMACENPDGSAGRFPVEFVVGSRRIQMYLTRFDDGRLQVLPVFLEVPRQRWFDYADFVFGGPAKLEIPADSPNAWTTYARNFNSRCGRCHTTNFTIGYDADAGTYGSSWTEPAVGCEACHGPGGEHVAKWRRLDRGPDPILNAGRMGIERSNQACGYCHTESTMVKPGFRAGDDLFAAVDVNGLEDDVRVHPDGRARELIHNLVPLMGSRCGPLACTDCHDAHGHDRPGDLLTRLDQDTLCLPCHQEIAVRLTGHTNHAAKSSGSRCIACHLPRLEIEAGHGRVFDHSISVPSIRNTEKFGIPNACASCHVEAPPGWVAESFARWYPGAEERNHRVALARTVAAARAGEPGAREPLLQLLEDENPIRRAAATWLLTRYDADLRPLLADPHPLVRRAAVKGVAARDPGALVPLLDDANAVLRRAAAMELAESYAYVRPRPELRERILCVLEEFVRFRPDHDRLHFEIAALHEMAGRTEEALRSYDRYLRLRPWDERAAAHAGQLRVAGPAR